MCSVLARKDTRAANGHVQRRLTIPLARLLVQRGAHKLRNYSTESCLIEPQKDANRARDLGPCK